LRGDRPLSFESKGLSKVRKGVATVIFNVRKRLWAWAGIKHIFSIGGRSEVAYLATEDPPPMEKKGRRV